METTLLMDQQIWGDDQGKGQLQVMKVCGIKTGISDLAIVLGSRMGSDKTIDNQRSGYVWSASSDGDGDVRVVRDDGDWGNWDPRRRVLGVRPALPSSVTSSINPSEARPTRQISGVQVVGYGEYPQSVAPADVSAQLEQALTAGTLQFTGAKYTFDGKKDGCDAPFSAKEYIEYQHKDKRYIRVEAQPYDTDSVLSNDHIPQTGEACWIEVQSIKWLVDPSGVWVARQALFPLQFDNKRSYDGDFAKTDMKHYLDTYFSEEMQPKLARVTDAPATGAAGGYSKIFGVLPRSSEKPAARSAPTAFERTLLGEGARNISVVQDMVRAEDSEGNTIVLRTNEAEHRVYRLTVRDGQPQQYETFDSAADPYRMISSTTYGGHDLIPFFRTTTYDANGVPSEGLRRDLSLQGLHQDATISPMLTVAAMAPNLLGSSRFC